MKKIAITLLISLASSLSMADNRALHMPLDKVVFQVSAKQWVSTQTALLAVSVNATLSNADLVKARAEIMANLAKIAAGDWHVMQFDRSQDSSGLEKLYVAAQVRVPQASLTNIYQHAKDVSKPGATYMISGVEFQPGLEEIQQAKLQLRQRLYQQVNEELARLNKVYTSQHYSVNRIYLLDGEVAQPQPGAYSKGRELKTMVMAAAAPGLTVSNELTMSAMVEAASNRQAANA